MNPLHNHYPFFGWIQLGITLSKHLTKGEETELTNIEGSTDQSNNLKNGSPAHRRIYVENPGESVITLGLYKRVVLSLAGQVYVEHRTMPGWSGALPFYAFRCPVHGIVVDYPHGYDQRLDCPKCHRESDFLRILTG